MKRLQPPAVAGPATAWPDDLVVDLENMFGAPWPEVDDALRKQRTRELLALAGPETRIYLVCAAELAAALCDVLVGSRADIRCVAPTPDAADKALQHHLAARTGRTRTVTLATGDGGFVPCVRELQASAATVTVVAVDGKLSNHLAWTADRVQLLEFLIA